MRDGPVESPCSFKSSLVFWEDGSVTVRGGYECAVRRLYEYERSGVPPDGEIRCCRKATWEPYTAKAPNGQILARRGWEYVLGRLFAYERSKLAPEQWKQRHKADPSTLSQVKADGKSAPF